MGLVGLVVIDLVGVVERVGHIIGLVACVGLVFFLCIFCYYQPLVNDFST